MPFASSRGYSSLKLQHDVAEMLIARYARTGQRVIVYFISDLDPSGLDLERAWKEALQNFNAPLANEADDGFDGFVRLGLTREQVRALPNARLRQGIEVKPSDSRAEKYIAQYGMRCWETDILPAATITSALDRHIYSWLDEKAWKQRAAEIERARALL